MIKANKEFMFGVSYCPYAKSGDVPMEQWDTDFKTMKKLNFNTVRAFVAWDRIEQEEGVYDYRKLDYLFELAEKYDMLIVLNIGGVFDVYGGIYPPRWLATNYNCQPVITNPKIQETHFGTLVKICLEDPVYKKKAEDFTIRTIKRFATQERLIGWNAWNENYAKEPCCCKHSLEIFRIWLKKKYNDDLGKVNEIWGTEFPINYKSWDEVQPALGVGFTSGGHAARLDWLSFNEDRIAEIDEHVVSLIKKHDPKKRPATSNIVISATEDPYIHGSVDLWKINSKMDISGFSFYTFFKEPYEDASAISKIRSSSRAPGKALWVLETEAGQVFNSEIYKKWGWNEVQKRELSNWQAVAHGAKMILLWKYGGRVTDTQTDAFNLMGWDGGITARAEVNAKVSKILQDNAAIINDKYYKSDVAILTSSEASTFHHVNGTKEEFKNAWYGAYKLLWDMHVMTDYVTNAGIHDGVLSQYKVLFMPCVMNMDKKTALKIEEFVRNGGCVIADLKTAITDENSKISPRAPGFGLDKVFGAYINDFLSIMASDESITCEKYGLLKLHEGDYKQRAELYPCNGAEIIGTYNSGKAAVVKNKHGKGTALWFGGNVFADYRKTAEKGIVPIIADILADAGAESKYILNGKNIENIEISDLRNGKGEKIIFLLNFNNRALEFELKFRDEIKSGEFRDMISGEKIKVSDNSCRISMKPCGIIALASA